MHRLFLAFMVALVVVAITAFMTTYTVRFTETAVVTRAGRKVAAVDEPGLKFKIPLIDRVTTYDKRVRLLQTRSVTQQTADESQIIIEAFATWRVTNPYEFYQRFRNAGERTEDQFAAAADILRSNLMSAMSETANYRIDELFNAEPGGTKLPALATRLAEAVRLGAGGERKRSRARARPRRRRSSRGPRRMSRRSGPLRNGARARSSPAARSKPRSISRPRTPTSSSRSSSRRSSSCARRWRRSSRSSHRTIS